MSHMPKSELLKLQAGEVRKRVYCNNHFPKQMQQLHEFIYEDLLDQYKEEIEQHFGDAAFGEVIKAMVSEAKGGDVQAAKLLLAYRLGTPTTHAEVSTDLNVGGSSPASETLRVAFGINDLPPRPDDDEDDDDDELDEEEQSGEEPRQSVALTQAARVSIR